MITHADLLQRLYYDKTTGVFTWTKSLRTARWVGKQAGWIDKQGYRYIRINKRLYSAHRLAWFYVTGRWPSDGVVDHINGNPMDNAFNNLRDVTKKINQENRRKASIQNKSGLLGVSPNGKRWAATINTSENGVCKHLYLGTFDTPELAHANYVQAKRRLHKGCTI